MKVLELPATATIFVGVIFVGFVTLPVTKREPDSLLSCWYFLSMVSVAILGTLVLCIDTHCMHVVDGPKTVILWAGFLQIHTFP